ncbi:nucleolar protein dao-5-like isoform X3 [Daphnia pulex]|uniref:nucleolar protein dao-5-like isoform X3 n=1 Tax=Daphnia pulex TaxID=6669 RepID=UPI001EE032B8|nr:nucleolar protein dao-5-like isoform X3 [Daphnia pulex]
MTILAPVEKAGTMEKLTDPVTSDSELEEGEIANDEIEIISEFIRHPPMKSQKSSPRKSIPGSNSISSRKLDSFAHRLKHSVSNSSGGGNVELKHVSELKPVPKTSREKPSISSKRKSPARTPKRLGQSRSRSTSTSKPDTSRSSRTRLNSTRSSRGRQSSNQAKKEEKLINSVTYESEESKEKKWKQSFEELLVTPGSVESIDDDSGSEGDEELKLRIEALNSVVVNAKPKDVSNDVVSSKSDSTPEPIISNGVQEEDEGDDEDEELLRAQLLIEVARKQTKELEVQMQPEEKDTKAEEPAVPNLAFERRNQATKIPSKSVHIPKADRLVIDLRNDSSDSSDEDDGVQSSITALLKSARQTVEEKSSIVPNALSHLPRNQQEEYQRLKQEIVRREKMKQGASKVSPLIQSQSDGLSKMDSTSGASTQLLLQQPVVISTHSEKSVNTVPPQVDFVPSMDQEMLICSPINTLDSTTPSPIILPHSASPGSIVKESEKNESIAITSGKSDGASVTRPTTTSTRPLDSLKKASPMKSNESNSPKLIALKQQLLHKKRDLASTKEALKCQLGLVDKNRLLWLNSSQEVNRLKALLQAAEGTERQLRTQLTNSQLQTQRLKTKMQSVERQVTVLHSGIGAHRTRRISAKLRPKLTNQPGLNSSTTTFTLPSLTPLRVKPRVFAKALAKTNHLTYHRPTTAAVDSEVSMSVKGSVQIKEKQNFSGVLEGNKALHDEQWLYGTLGDDWSQSNVVSDFPKWSPHGHASRFLSNEGFRVDSSLVVCRYQLDSTPCQIVPCPFQHLLPQKDVRQLEKSSPMVSKSTASASRGEV